MDLYSATLLALIATAELYVLSLLASRSSTDETTRRSREMEESAGAGGGGALPSDPQDVSDAAAPRDREGGDVMQREEEEEEPQQQQQPAVEGEVDVFLTAASQVDTEMDYDGDEAEAQVDVETEGNGEIGRIREVGAKDAQPPSVREQRDQRDTSGEQALSIFTSTTNSGIVSSRNMDDNVDKMDTDKKVETDEHEEYRETTATEHHLCQNPSLEDGRPHDRGQVDDRHMDQIRPVPNNEQPKSPDNLQMRDENGVADDACEQGKEDSEHAANDVNSNSGPGEEKQELLDHTPDALDRQPPASAEDGNASVAREMTQEVENMNNSSEADTDFYVNRPSLTAVRDNSSSITNVPIRKVGETSNTNPQATPATSSSKSMTSSTTAAVCTDSNSAGMALHRPGAGDVAEPPPAESPVSSPSTMAARRNSNVVADMPRPTGPRPERRCAVEGCTKKSQGRKNNFMCITHNNEWVCANSSTRKSNGTETTRSRKRKERPSAPSSTTEHTASTSSLHGRRSKRERRPKTAQLDFSPDEDLKTALRLSMLSPALRGSGTTRHGRANAATSVGLMEEAADAPSLIDKVVRLTTEGRDETKWKRILGVEPLFYFVLSYNPESNWCDLVPMKKVGTISEAECGASTTSIGRDKWVLFDEKECRDLSFEVYGDLVEIVKAKALANTDDADEELWDVLRDFDDEVDAAAINNGAVETLAFAPDADDAASILTPKFKRNNAVFAYDEGNYYEAIIRKVGEYDEEKGWMYQVHFKGWAKRYDKWVPESELEKDPPQESPAGTDDNKVGAVSPGKEAGLLEIDSTTSEGKLPCMQPARWFTMFLHFLRLSYESYIT